MSVVIGFVFYLWNVGAKEAALNGERAQDGNFKSKVRNV